jgi:hypothetical protein
MFTQFWTLYPRKVGKRVAQKSWQRLTAQEQSDVLEALPNHIKYWKLKNTETDFIPHPATWLNQGRWEDELDMTEKVIKKPALPWYSSDDLTIAKGRELGLNAYAGESMGQFRQRIAQEIAKVGA